VPPFKIIPVLVRYFFLLFASNKFAKAGAVAGLELGPHPLTCPCRAPQLAYQLSSYHHMSQLFYLYFSYL
jgi:hypothetical protein